MSINLNIELFEKYLSGTMSPDDQKKLESWIEADPVRLEELKDMKIIWESSKKRGISVNVDRAFQRVIEQTDIERTPDIRMQPKLHYYERKKSFAHSSFYQALRVAAVIVFLIGIGFFVMNDRPAPVADQTTSETQEIITERGQRTQLRFGDGTLITLNEMSVLRFSKHVSNDTREVHLAGEAFFEVTPGEKQFIVRAEDAIVKVHGTSFNVSAWPDNDWVDVVVTEGSVSVNSDSAPDSDWLVLREKDRSRIVRGMGPTSPEKVDMQAYIAWLSGKLIFDNTPLKEVLSQLERRYDVTFIVSDPALYARRLTASLKDESINDALNLFHLTLNLKFELMDSVVVISRVDE